jgi:hypothetical protein
MRLVELSGAVEIFDDPSWDGCGVQDPSIALPKVVGPQIKIQRRVLITQAGTSER